MKLSSIQLAAFFEVAKTLNFTQAADQLHITQSALSQRIMNLEEDLGKTLFIRGKTIRLTEQGEKLLRYCQMQAGLESELLQDLKNTEQMGGLLRIAGFSSVMWSVIMPSLSEMIRSNPAIQTDFKVLEIRDLLKALTSGEVDFIVTGEKINKEGLKTHILGFEENVYVVSKKFNETNDKFLDHDSEDPTTVSFLKRCSKPAPKKRSYLDDIYGIIEGVTLGWGSAIVPRHLVENNKDIKLKTGVAPQRSPVYLSYYEQPYYSKLHETTVSTLLQNSVKILTK